MTEQEKQTREVLARHYKPEEVELIMAIWKEKHDNKDRGNREDNPEV